MYDSIVSSLISSFFLLSSFLVVNTLDRRSAAGDIFYSPNIRNGSGLFNMYSDSDTLVAARSQPNDNWGSVGNGARLRRKARRWWLWYV